MNVSGSSYLNRSISLESKNVKTFALPDKCFEKRIACTWRSGNKLTIYPRSQTVSKTTTDTSGDKIVNIRQEVLLFTSILRKLVNESNGTYLSLQKAAETAKNSDNQVEFLKLSRQYRSVIRVCIESLQEAAEKELNGIEKNALLSYITIFYSIECIWHLCEILYVDIIPGDVVLPYLLEWVRFHFPCHEQVAAQMLEACERGSEEHPDYWDTVVGMVVQGRVDVARALLKLHSATDSNEFKLLDNSLRTMPLYSVYGGISTGEFTISWKHWQAECRSKLSNRTFASQPKLELILRLIIGDYSAFESIRDKYNSWFDILGGWVMYTAPWARRHELSAAAAACAGMRALHPSRTHLDVMVRALLDGDLHQVISEIQQISDNGWFATHLTDMLFHCGKLKILDKHQTDVTPRLRDSLILEYGCLLMEHKSLWSVGLSYLASCPPEGLKRAELMLERLPIKTEAKAMRVVAEAKKYGLLGVAQSVSCVESARARRGAVGGARGGAGAALAWALRARSPALAQRAAHAALRAYTQTDGNASLPAPDLLLTAGASMLLSDSLLFLGKYCDFHRLYKSREFKKAAKLLVSLITSNIAPDYFWETLLLDALPLLESDEPILSSSDTFELMQCLELKSKELTGERADLLRLALSRNLARTLLEDVPDPN
ncbi:nuclear pore complex protein Nup85 isoform X2 [Plodia interpunctella]|uniref:nuclear pore complex protein Nup85 isoform X2 n=1 Tax=Plodia interpunctella TaxID=58824 RepID=UPI0023689636|nr:nuclear pore complex protein Nup85 isoform X2 [Plodia interpunctella]